METVNDWLYFFNLTSPAKVDYLDFTAGLLTLSNPQRLPVYTTVALCCVLTLFTVARQLRIFTGFPILPVFKQNTVNIF